MPQTKPTSEQVTFLAAGSGASQRTVLDKLRDVVSVKDFGAVGDGTTDDTTAIQAACDAASGKIVVFPRGAYRINSTVNLPSAGITIDLGKSTILPYGTSRGLYCTAPTATATTTWASGFTRGTTVLGVGSATGMAVGQWLVVQPVRTGATSMRVAAHTSKIVDISGTNITIADPLPMDYTGLATTAYLDIKTYTALHGDCQITNGAIDNRNGTENPSFPDYGIGLVLYGYENVLVENVEFIGPSTTTLESRAPCAINGPGLNATLDNCRFVDAVHAGNLLNVYGYNKANITNSYIDGSAFGIQFVSCGYAEASSNYVTGLQAEEVRQAASPARSVRGLKSFGCAQISFQDNYVSGYESATKIEYTESFIVSGNYCINCTFSATGSSPSSAGGCINTGNQNSVSSQISSLISNNVVVNCDGSAILVSDPTNPVVIDGNTVRNIGRYAIQLSGGDNCVITNNSAWEALKDASFTTEGVIDFSTTTDSTCDGNVVFNTVNTTVNAIRGHVSTHYGMGNKSTSNKLKDTGGRVIHSINSNVTGAEALPGTTNWVSPTVLCGVGAIEPLSMSAPSVPTTESLRFDLPAGCLFMVAANNRACLAFGDQNAAGITLIGTATAGVFTNTIGSAGTINISKSATSNQIRIQNSVASTQTIRVCAFGGTPTSITVAP